MGSIKQTGEPVRLIAAQPQIHGGTRHLRQRGNLLFQSAFRILQHNLHPSCRRRSNIHTFYHGLQLSPLAYR